MYIIMVLSLHAYIYAKKIVHVKIYFPSYICRYNSSKPKSHSFANEIFIFRKIFYTNSKLRYTLAGPNKMQAAL